MPFITDLFVKGTTLFLTKLITSIASTTMVEWAFFKVAESIVKSTNTVHDDEWLTKIKEVYKEVNK